MVLQRGWKYIMKILSDGEFEWFVDWINFTLGLVKITEPIINNVKDKVRIIEESTDIENLTPEKKEELLRLLE
jgi:hypothetical protein